MELPQQSGSWRSHANFREQKNYKLLLCDIQARGFYKLYSKDKYDIPSTWAYLFDRALQCTQQLP
jgi:hypothetical protein